MLRTRRPRLHLDRIRHPPGDPQSSVFHAAQHRSSGSLRHRSSGSLACSACISRFCECCIRSSRNSVVMVSSTFESRNHGLGNGKDDRGQHDVMSCQHYRGFRHAEKMRSLSHGERMRQERAGSGGDLPARSCRSRPRDYGTVDGGKLGFELEILVAILNGPEDLSMKNCGVAWMGTDGRVSHPYPRSPS